MANLQKRLEKLEEKAAPDIEEIIVVTGMDGPEGYRVNSEVFHDMAAVEAAHPGVKFHVINVVYDDSGKP